MNGKLIKLDIFHHMIMWADKFIWMDSYHNVSHQKPRFYFNDDLTMFCENFKQHDATHAYATFQPNLRRKKNELLQHRSSCLNNIHH